MSSTPDEGEDGALVEDIVDLPERRQSHQDRVDGQDEPVDPEDDPGVLEDAPEQLHGEQTVAHADIDAESSTGPSSPAQARQNGNEVLPNDEDSISIPDDSPSVQGSVLSSPRSEAPSFLSPGSRSSPSGVHRPFDRRFQSRLSSSPIGSPRAQSPAFLNTHSRQASIASIGSQNIEEPDPTSTPWDVVRWTRLRKVTGQAFSEVGKRKFGRPTCMAVTTSIVIGTTKGLLLVFDYQQNHRGIIGMGTKAVECGAVTSIAISADHTTIVAGYAEGHIFTWEIARSAKPFLHIPPVANYQPQAQKGEGHIEGVSVLHIGFLGTRHTAVVSADDRGMAFSHLASRGMGAVARNVRTTRVLGRYPDMITRTAKPRKPSSVLAFSSLPLGNVEQATDSIGLVAMMTPYLLVIVSTTPIAQTQHKSARPKEVAAHSAMSAALAWFPAIKLKDGEGLQTKTKLVYCWSNVLTVLEVSINPPIEPVEKDKPPELEFRPRSRWKSEEAIVAVQWLSRSVMAVLTITQQLVILEDVSMHVADFFDILQKHIYHDDLYSQQLNSLVEQLDEEDSSMHGVVADAFHMSFRAYKGRLFLLGFNDISIGSLSNWADRLLASMEAGDFIGAIRLANSYYTGEAEKLTIGLPEEDLARHAVVGERLLEMISASLKYAFGRNEQAGAVHLEASQLEELAAVCITACISIDDLDFMFDAVYAWYDNNAEASLFLDVLEPYIVSGQVKSLPPTAVKRLIEHFVTTHAASSLEEIICLLDTSTMDIDQVTNLCKKHNLYDAYIYVWNTTLHDYTTPLEELLKMTQTGTAPNGHTEAALKDHHNSEKLFPYLSFIWTGRTYPTGTAMDEIVANTAKEQVYDFFFSGSSPRSNAKPRMHVQPYPHLHRALSFDAASFISVLNEAFEDSYLNDEDEYEPSNGALDRSANSKTMNRQYIVRIMLEVAGSEQFAPEDSIYFDMFVARNVPKYPKAILLSGAVLHQVLVRLCRYPTDDMADDCQLSAEYLLSTYHPPDLLSLVPVFREAQFYRVLKTTFKSERQYAELIKTFLQTQEGAEEVFVALTDFLQEGSDLTVKQQREVLDVVKEHARDLVSIDVCETATTFARLDPGMHGVFLNVLDQDSRNQYEYLKAIIEGQDTPPPSKHQAELIERYIQLMCQFNPAHIAEFVESLGSGDLRLVEVLPSLESSGVVDAAVILLARQGQGKNAMDRLVKHLGTLETALSSILHNVRDSPDEGSTNEAVRDLLESISKYAGVGIWLCQYQTRSTQKARPVVKSPKRSSQQSLSFEEATWLAMINAVVSLAKSPSIEPTTVLEDQVTSSVRSTVQRVFTALLTAMTSRDGNLDRSDFSFLRVLRAFLTHAAVASPSLAELRSVIGSIFSAYAYEESLLALSNTMLDKDLFVQVDEVYKLRKKGWRPKGQICEVCRRRVWGPGTGSQIWAAWETEQVAEMRRRQLVVDDNEDARGKGKAARADSEEVALAAEDVSTLGPVAVFSCRHVYHQKCLGAGGRARQHENLELVCPACV